MKTDLEKYQDELRENGIIWTRGGDDTDIQIIVGDKVAHFNADGSHMDGVAAPIENQHRLIKGYRDLTQPEIDLMNEIKQKGAELGDLVAKLKGRPNLDQRWVSIGATDLQTGLMALTRSVAQPTFF